MDIEEQVIHEDSRKAMETLSREVTETLTPRKKNIFFLGGVCCFFSRVKLLFQRRKTLILNAYRAERKFYQLSMKVSELAEDVRLARHDLEAKDIIIRRKDKEIRILRELVQKKEKEVEYWKAGSIDLLEYCRDRIVEASKIADDAPHQ